MLDVEIDVGRSVALQREEPLEEQSELHRVGLGDPERETHRAVGRAAPPLAVDVVVATEAHDLDEHEEVAGEIELLDHVELVGDLAHRLLVVRAVGRVANRGAFGGELAQPGHLGMTDRYLVVGKLRRGEPQVERAGTGDLDGALDCAGPSRETA